MCCRGLLGLDRQIPLEVTSRKLNVLLGRLSRALTGGVSYPIGMRPTSVAGAGMSIDEAPVNPNELMYRESATNYAN